MLIHRSAAVSLVFLLAAGCLSSSGGDTGGTSSSSGGGGDDAAGSSSGSDATASSSSSGGSSSSGSSSGSDAHGGSSSSSEAGSEGGSSDGGVSGALAGGTAAVAAFCSAGCNRASTCAAMQADAAPVDLSTCTSSCETQNGGGETLYRADYWAADTACVASATCADTNAGTASASCSKTVLAAASPDTTVVSFCTAVENVQGGCVPAAGCLSTYKVLSDATVMALAACLPNICSNPDAGAGCFGAALTPH